MKPTRGKTPAGARTPGLGHGRTPLRTPFRGTAASAKPRAPLADTHKDPVEVFCRVRPSEEEEETCIKQLSDTTVQLAPPESSKAFASGKETQYSFKTVFGEDSSQSEVFQRVGLPLVEDIVEGKNGLLFTYGVTGSGKTHTMQGSLQDGGVMSRCIDVIFNSLADLQTKKYRLKPDKTNGFEIVSDAEAALLRQKDMINNMKTPRSRRQNTSDPDLSNRVSENVRVKVDEDAQYSVFISYTEVYNNYIYDLLENSVVDIVTGKPKLLSKMLREDSFRNMYVHGATEVEVKSPEEALENFYKGQRQRKVAQTLLNLNSSRSHSVFNIRVVAVPYDTLGEDILADPTVMTVGQLALVDLAGSERTARTGNTGDRLQEASKINQSLMTLRSCIETLRDNQKSGGSKMVPYRDSRITHLFRNYFEGEGKVKMIVCVNPRASDFDENLNVMKFAELTQEVQIERPTAVRFDLGLTPGRRRGNQIYKEAIRRLDSNGGNRDVLMELAPLYSLGPAWPPLVLNQCDEEEVIEKLRSFLEKRIATRSNLLTDHNSKTAAFRELLRKQDEEVVLLRNENRTLKAQLESERKRWRQMETRLANAESANRSLNEKVNAYEDMKVILENELDEKELEINKEQKERIKNRLKYKQKLMTEKERISSELDRKLQMQRLKMKEKNTKINGKLNELNQLIYDDTVSTQADENIENGAVRTTSNPDLSRNHERGRTPMKTSSSDPRLSMTPAPRKSSLAVANLRHRRSQSAGGGAWLDHRPREGVVPLSTVLQPVVTGRRKSVSKLEEKDVVNARTSKYLLTTQNQGNDGEMETRLYKGDVVPTVSGGRQVIFNDVEVLTQESPTGGSQSPRKRSYEDYQGIRGRIADIEGRCNYGIQATPVLTRSQGKRSRH